MLSRFDASAPFIRTSLTPHLPSESACSRSRSVRVAESQCCTVLARFTALIVLMVGCAIARLAPASMVVPGDISNLAKDAKVIFAGTVASIRSEWNAGRTTIVTKVLFKDVIMVKGDPAPVRTELTLSGGKVGDDEIVTEGQPQFLAGARYILLCNSTDLGSERNRYLPIIGLNQGFFPVRPNRRTGRPVVLDGGGREIVSIQNGKLVIVSPSLGENVKAGPRPSAIDLPFTPRRGRPGGKDSLINRSNRPREQSNATGTAIPRSGNRPARNNSVPPVDWVRGSQHLVITGEPVVRVLDPGSDPGTRMSESQFLNEIRRLMTP